MYDVSHRFQAILFDFDFTLADSSRGVVDCINYALSELCLPAVSYETACRTIGLSLGDTLIQVAGTRYAGRRKEFSQLFVHRADQVMADQTVLFASVPDAVKHLEERGFTLGIVSTKYRYRIEAVLAREGLPASFDVIVGGEDVSNHKPHPESLLLAVGKLDRQRQEVLYVGDSVTDAQAAERAEVPFAAVLSGVTSRDEFQSYPLYGVLENLSQLGNLLGSEG
jgi:phosphoglycolate phosphatase